MHNKLINTDKINLIFKEMSTGNNCTALKKHKY